MELWWVLVVLGLAIIVYAKWVLSNRNEEDTASTDNRVFVKEMEETITSFVVEMQEENDLFIDRIKKIKEQTDKKIAQLEKREQLFEKRIEQLEEELSEAKHNLLQASPKLNQQSLANRSFNIRQRYPNVFSLYDQKKSIDEIVQLTGLNKGEVQLVVQLADREAKLNVE